MERFLNDVTADYWLASVDPVVPRPEVWRRLRRSVEQLAAHECARARPRRPD